MASDKTVQRRRYGSEFKAQVVAQCGAPGASVAKVAMSHGINANVVHGWRKQAREAGVVALPRQGEFVPLQLAAPVAQPVAATCIEVELHRGPVAMKITWPLSATADLAAWTREVLR